MLEERVLLLGAQDAVGGVGVLWCSEPKSQKTPNHGMRRSPL